MAAYLTDVRDVRAAEEAFERAACAADRAAAAKLLAVPYCGPPSLTRSYEKACAWAEVHSADDA